MLPSLESILAEKDESLDTIQKHSSVRALFVAPTRELAIQMDEGAEIIKFNLYLMLIYLSYLFMMSLHSFSFLVVTCFLLLLISYTYLYLFAYVTLP